MASVVANKLLLAAKIYEQRNALYGMNYKNFGAAFAAIFPEGIKVNSAGDFNRLGLYVQMLSKMTRYAAQWENGGHPDSLDDLSVYAMMLSEIDDEERANRVFTESLKESFSPAQDDGPAYEKVKFVPPEKPVLSPGEEELTLPRIFQKDKGD